MKPSGRITRQVEKAKHLATVIDEQGTVSDEALERLLKRAAERTADQARKYQPVSVFFQAMPDPDDHPIWNAPAPGTCCPDCTHHRSTRCDGCGSTRCLGQEVREIEVTARVVE